MMKVYTVVRNNAVEHETHRKSHVTWKKVRIQNYLEKFLFSNDIYIEETSRIKIKPHSKILKVLNSNPSTHTCGTPAFNS